MALHTACKRSITSLALLLFFAAPALRADTSWSWTYNSSPSSNTIYSGNGTFTTTPTSDGDLIESITGTWDGDTITGLVMPSSDAGDEGSNDNLLLSASASQPQLSSSGISFTTAGDVWNIFFDGSADNIVYFAFDLPTDPNITATSDDGNGIFSASIDSSVASPVPEPSPILLLSTALGALLLFSLYRKQNAAADIA